MIYSQETKLARQREATIRQFRDRRIEEAKKVASLLKEEGQEIRFECYTITLEELDFDGPGIHEYDVQGDRGAGCQMCYGGRAKESLTRAILIALPETLSITLIFRITNAFSFTRKR